MNNQLEEIERLFLALSDKTRIRLVDLMRDGEVSVNYLCETLGESQPKVSRHLAYLRSMGMVNTRREGKWIYYSLAEPENRFGSRLLVDTLSWVASLTQGNSVSPSSGAATSSASMKNTENRQVENTYVYTNIKDVDSDDLEVYLL